MLSRVRFQTRSCSLRAAADGRFGRSYRGHGILGQLVIRVQRLAILHSTEYSRHMKSTELREPSFWVLTALAAGRSHGYALIQETRSLSSGRVDLKVPTLYAALDRLREQGLVALDGDEVTDGRLRRYFRLTDDGASRLSEEIQRMEANARQAKARLRMRPTPAARTALV